MLAIEEEDVVGLIRKFADGDAWHAFDSHVVLPSIGSDRIVAVLFDFVMTLTLWRLLQKCYFTASLYGPLQGALCLLRQPLATYINAMSMVLAMKTFFTSIISGKPMNWAKTAHVVPSDVAFTEFRRELGQLLVAEHKIDEKQLAYAVANQEHGKERLGETLVRLGMVDESDLVGALADQLGCETALEDDLIPDPELIALIPEDTARRHLFLPLRVEEGAVLVAVAALPDRELSLHIRNLLKRPYSIRLAERKRLAHAVERSYRSKGDRRKPIGGYLVDGGFIDREALDEALAMQKGSGTDLFQIIVQGGILSDPDEIARAVEGYFGEVTRPLPTRHVPKHALHNVPVELLRDNEVVIVEAEGKCYIAAPYPLRAEFVQKIAEAMGKDLEVLLARADDVKQVRHTLAHEVRELAIS